MNRTGILVASAFLGLVVVGACSSDSTPVGDGPSTDGGTGAGPDRVVHVDEVRAALKPLADAECKWLFHCCNAEERADELGPAPTADDCADRVLQAESVTYSYYALPLKDSTKAILRELSRLGYGFDYGRVSIVPAAVQACAKAISDAACNPAPPKENCAPKVPSLDDPCTPSKLLVGKQQLGEDCDGNSYDCAAGLFCQYVDGNRGVCLKSPKEGDTCFESSDCGEAVCDFATGRCVKGADFGAACSYADPDHPELGTEKIRCRPGLLCDTVTLKCSDTQCAGGSNCQLDSSCPAGTTCVNFHCGKPVKAGGQCNKDADCEGGVCRYDQVVMRQLCATPAVDGAICQQDDDCASHFCKFIEQTSACAPQLPIDAPCPSGQGSECTSGKCGPGSMGLVCLKGPAVGDACASDMECNPQGKLFCSAMKCAKAPLADGADCATAQTCKSEVCLAKKCTAKGQEGAPCGTSKSAPCDLGFRCDVAADGSPEGTCKAKKPEGAPCTSATECWGDCRVSHGQLRCVGTGAGQAHCGG